MKKAKSDRAILLLLSVSKKLEQIKSGQVKAKNYPRPK